VESRTREMILNREKKTVLLTTIASKYCLGTCTKYHKFSTRLNPKTAISSNVEHFFFE
jgi:hypothetical protein